jgi:uncharacterized protein YndB with AHSA1/START domain
MATKATTQITAEPGVPQIVLTREFAAPRELVFRAYTDPELLVQWLGPRRMTMTIDYFDVRDAGRWRYTHRDTDGSEVGFHGVFHGTPSPENGIVQTFEFEGAPGHVSLETLTLEEREGKTLVRTNDVFQSVEDRDAAVESGMESGINESMERLDELLARLTSAKLQE